MKSRETRLTDIVKKTVIAVMTAGALAGCARREQGYIKEVGELKKFYNTAQFDMLVETRHGMDTLSVYGPLLEIENAHSKAQRNNYVNTTQNEPDNESRIDVSPSETMYRLD